MCAALTAHTHEYINQHISQCLLYRMKLEEGSLMFLPTFTDSPRYLMALIVEKQKGAPAKVDIGIEETTFKNNTTCTILTDRTIACLAASVEMGLGQGALVNFTSVRQPIDLMKQTATPSWGPHFMKSQDTK